MIDIAGADERRPLPGDREHRAAVIRVEEGDRLRERQTPGVEQQMAAPQRPQLRRPADRTAQAVAPRDRFADGRLQGALPFEVRLEIRGDAKDEVE